MASSHNATILSGDVPDFITEGFEKGLAVLGRYVDLSPLPAIRIEIDRTIPTAEARGTDLVVINPDYESAVRSYWFRPNVPEATAMHEILHLLGFSLGNAGFDNWTANFSGSLYFVGPNAWEAYGGPVPVDEHGHIMLPNLIMSGVGPFYRDGPQVPSGVELAMLRDIGVHVWSDSERLVNSVYHEVLGREADVDGRQYWSRELEAGHVSADNFVQVFIAGIVV